MLWGIIGLFIMVAVFGIMRIILSTLGENKIKINSNGDFVVDGGTLVDKNIAANPNSGATLTNPNGIDISTTLEAQNLPIEAYTTSPFPVYQTDPLCWNRAVMDKGSTEYNALDLARAKARSLYLKETGVLDTDKTKTKYPNIISTKVLYDKNTKTYYAWLDARAPIKTGTEANCNLKILSPAKAIPDSILFSEKNASTTLDPLNMPHDFFITSPFATYKPNPLCWNNGNKPFYASASTEYKALDLIDTMARSKYLKDNNILATDPVRIYYPVKFEQQTLYEKSTDTYHIWLDARAPIKEGKMSDCKLEVLTSARETPESTIFSKVVATSDQINLSTTVIKSNITNFTESPFIEYKANPLCWRKELYGNHTTEFGALEIVKVKSRMQYLNDNHLTDANTPQALPTKYGVYNVYDKVTKNYYVWWDVRAPIKDGTPADCNLIPLDPNYGIPDPSAQSSKRNPFTTNYTSDNDYYRVIDSGVDPSYTGARNKAINNALIQIANLAGVNRMADVPPTTILEEKYYQLDVNTNNYDYWVVLQAHK